MKEFADHIQCDPELAQELYFEHDVDLTSDGADKMSLDAQPISMRSTIDATQREQQHGLA